ncbi:MAG TPA: O-antigen ligase family protein [Pyrinomonadaceae bacterium]|nr:O-antigen ligase family protein [Pyrinomonadaceae bacterium]
MNSNTPTRVIRWLFYAFVLSLPFETVGEGWFEPTTGLGGLLLLSALVQPGLFLRWPPKGFWCFVVYLYVFAGLSLLEPSGYRQATLLNVFLLAQLTVLGWIGFCLMRDRQTAERALLTFAAGCVFLSLLQVTGFASRAVEADVATVVRVTAFGFHPNNLARILMLGMLALVGLTLARSTSFIRPLLFVGPFVLLIGVALVQTGSRGGLIALAAGVMTLVLRRGTMMMKVLNGLGLMALLGVFFVAALQSDIMRARFEETIEEGDVARRDMIYPTAFEMFKEKPLLGWGPISSTYELGMRLGHPEEETKNPHNLILFGLVSNGLVGSLPLFVGLAFSGLSAWKMRSGPHGILPLAMFVAVIVANMSGLWLFNKLHWLVMAYALASLYHGARETIDQSVEPNLVERELVTI